jgi:3-oxoadipate enol-lactonase
MTDRSISVPGANLNTVDEGSGPPIVLLHAGIADLRAWDALVPHLTAAGYRLIRYDQRGFGRTVTKNVAFSNRADCIAVLDALGIGQAVLVGNSRGGQIAIDTAIEFPDRIAALVGVGG